MPPLTLEKARAAPVQESGAALKAEVWEHQHRNDGDEQRASQQAALLCDVSAVLAGEADARAILDTVRTTCTTGDEIERALRAIVGPLMPVTAARLRGFARTLQKAALERVAVSS